MTTVHSSYLCSCQIPKAFIYMGEDTGLCSYCNGVYDENLYERRLRQHVKGFQHESVHDFLMATDIRYQAIFADQA